MERKNLGIVRRVDDFGRIVIPKEIRRAMKLKEGDPVEFINYNGLYVIQRYVPEPTEELKMLLENVIDYVEGNIESFDGDYLEYLHKCRELAEEIGLDEE